MSTLISFAGHHDRLYMRYPIQPYMSWHYSAVRQADVKLITMDTWQYLNQSLHRCYGHVIMSSLV